MSGGQDWAAELIDTSGGDMSERYFVDRRVGCVAVRDRTLVDPEYSGLHSDMECVVRFWKIPKGVVTCESCGSRHEQHLDGEVEASMAQRLADHLNSHQEQKAAE